jgi:hypothetical protein
MKFANWMIGICLFTASFDIILTVNLGGSVRFTQMVMLLFCFAAMAKMLQERRLLWPRGGTALVLWIAWLCFFLPQAGSWLVGLQMFGLLVYSAAGVFAVVQVYGRSTHIEWLMKIYMASFVFIMAIGLMQFALPLIGLHSFYVTEWVLHGKLARINGFTQEPSYYATYMILGWIMMVELHVSKARIARGRWWGLATILITIALFLCTSKAGWAVMLIEILARSSVFAWRGLRYLALQVSEGRLRLPLPRRSRFAKLVLSLCLLLAVSIPSAQWLFKHVDPLDFLNGSGLANTPAHSFDIRSRDTAKTWRAIKDHPMIGRSLGGVSVEIAANYGVHVTSMDVARRWWGFPVLLDVLAASGVFGFIPFLIFLYANTVGAYRLANRYMPDERAKWLRALARAMIFEWLMLLVDQNILRVYLWYHFAMLAAVAYHLVHMPVLETVPVRSRFSWRLLRTVPYSL